MRHQRPDGAVVVNADDAAARSFAEPDTRASVRVLDRTRGRGGRVRARRGRDRAPRRSRRRGRPADVVDAAGGRHSRCLRDRRCGRRRAREARRRCSSSSRRRPIARRRSAGSATRWSSTTEWPRRRPRRGPRWRCARTTPSCSSPAAGCRRMVATRTRALRSARCSARSATRRCARCGSRSCSARLQTASSASSSPEASTRERCGRSRRRCRSRSRPRRARGSCSSRLCTRSRMEEREAFPDLVREAAGADLVRDSMP